ncbi:MAG: shikimate kinase [Actinobacteria bacterium]|nr:shikimate kinase [Actinomycetota bacterium]MBW3651936.1 shikimate kinase [Actinomycetota bacterium]
MAERILLVGMMGSGKTTIGRMLAERLGWDYLDSDEQVCRNTGRSVREIFETDGEAAFRAEEKRALHQAVSGDQPAVVAVAGGAVLDEENRATLAQGGTVIWLDAPPEVLAGRVRAGSDHRPLLGDDAAAALERLDRERRPLYQELADVVVDAASKPANVVDRILRAIG